MVNAGAIVISSLIKVTFKGLSQNNACDKRFLLKI